MSSQFVCDLSSCRIFLENPVTLPCGFTICQEHLKYSDQTENVQIKCETCNEEHEIPVKFLVINKRLCNMLNTGNHLSEKQKELKAKLVQLETILLDHEKSKLSRPEEYIYDYFAEIRNKIDLHREESMQEIQKQSDALLKELNDLEDKCKVNQTRLEPLCFDVIKNKEVVEIKDSLRKPDISEQELDQLLVKMKSNIKDVQDKIDAYRENLTLNNDIVFYKGDEEGIYFGALVIANTLKEFKEVTEEDGNKYEGEMLNGVKHGYGKMHFKSGDTYEGHWLDGFRTGQGVFNSLTYRYEGDFHENDHHGKGTYINPLKGIKYTGDWSNNKITGHGVFYFNDDYPNNKGDIYEGQFLDGLCHGKGTYYYANGDSFTGQWFKGKKVRSNLN